jgi:cytochrome c biogenesis protein CcmG/thiol:disulfide interchange protein DsbE
VRVRLLWPVTLAAAALVALLAYGVASKGADTTLDQAILQGQRPAAPTRELPRLGAPGQASLADYRGKVVVLNMWASWCPPCRDEIPLLQRTQKRIQRAGGTVLGVDTEDDSTAALGFMRARKVTFPSLRDRDRSYGREFGVTGYPETFLIDRRGRVAAVRRFPVDRSWLDQHLTALLAERA